ncbi:MAG: TMEM175 family protein, partial [Rhodanobacteraceae bacterium]
MTEKQRGFFEGERIDNFVDGAFAFVVTLLVINGATIPRDIPSLIHALGGVTAFAAAFAQLSLFWYGHVKWRDQVHLVDLRSMQLSLVLVFFALIFVYPLHMVFASFFYFISGGILTMDITISSVADLKVIFIIYGVTYACMAGTLAWLFMHGLRCAGHLTRAERIDTGVSAFLWGFKGFVGLVSACIAMVIPKSA